MDRGSFGRKDFETEPDPAAEVLDLLSRAFKPRI